MGLKQDISQKVTEILAPGNYQVYDVGPVPGPGDSRLTFGPTGVRFDAVTLYIDMRGSTAVLNAHRAHSVAKIHKAYLFVATKLIAQHGGHIRSYNGDSILAFFEGKGKDSVEKAVKAAMQIKYMLTDPCAADFRRYREVDFGIGIDVGSILCVKAGMGRNDNHNDLIWLGDAVNRATVLSDAARGPNHVWISSNVRGLLSNVVQMVGQPQQDMWTQGEVVYNDKTELAWRTTYRWPVD